MPETVPEKVVAAPGKAASKTTKFLTKKTFGMPRWLMLTMLGGAVGVGLYLRSRAEEPPPETDDYYPEPIGGIDDPGMAGAPAFIGQAPGATVPVPAPYIPPEITDAIGDLVGTIGDIVIERPPPTHSPPPDTSVPTATGTKPKPTNAPPTGGGAPGGATVVGYLSRAQVDQLPGAVKPTAKRMIGATGSRQITKAQQQILVGLATTPAAKAKVRMLIAAPR